MPGFVESLGKSTFATSVALEVLRREREARPALVALLTQQPVTGRVRRHRNVVWHNELVPSRDAPEAEWCAAHRGARLQSCRTALAPTAYVAAACRRSRPGAAKVDVAVDHYRPYESHRFNPRLDKLLYAVGWSPAD